MGLKGTMRFRGPVSASTLPGGVESSRLPGPRRHPTYRQIPCGPRRSRRFKVTLAAAALGGAGVAWLAVTAVLVRDDLHAVRADAATLRTQLAAADGPAAAGTAESLSRHARRAHSLTGGPAWWLAQRIPVLGEPVRTVAGVTAAADELADGALGPLVRVGDRLDPATLRDASGRIDIAALAEARPALDAAAASLDRARAITAGLPASTYLSVVDQARAEVAATLTRLDRTVQHARTAARVVPPMLGADGPRTYFVAFQNDAEARGTGGLPGAFAILRAEDGRLRFERFETDHVMVGVQVRADLPAEYERLYGTSPEQIYVNSNLSPHFPYAARIWAAMWEKKTGQRVDGALAVDPTALSRLLAVTGPARLADGHQVSAANVVAETQNAVYLRYGADVAGRKRHLIDVARAVADRIITFEGNPTGLVRALTGAVDDRRLLLWSADPVLQAELGRTPLAGAVPQTTAPYVGMTVINSGGNKLDYYLDRSIEWERTGCGARRAVRVTMRLTNTVPASVPAGLLTERSDHRRYAVRPGDHRVAVYYAATTGAVLRKAALDGRSTAVQSGAERGHPVFVVDVELPRGATRTVTLDLTEPGTDGPPVVFRQPLIRPLQATVRDTECAP